jgi:hypothetical protein
VRVALQRRAIERRAYTHRQQFVSRGDKATRAQSFRGRMAMLGLHVPTRAPWYPALRSELLSFPAGKYDDQGAHDLDELASYLLDRITGPDYGAPARDRMPENAVLVARSMGPAALREYDCPLSSSDAVE